MCTAWERLKQEVRQEGIQEGIQEGMQKGIQKGRLEGMFAVYQGLGVSDIMIIQNLQKELNLSEQEARACLRQHEKE